MAVKLIINRDYQMVDTTKIPKGNGSLLFIDLFSGAGGISLGLTNAGYSKFFSVEIRDAASRTIRRNFPGSLHYQIDINTLSDNDILRTAAGKKIAIVCGGPPCQGFSIVNPKRSIDDPRNKLFYQYLRVVRLVQPKIAIMENVESLAKLDNGSTLKRIEEEFAFIGYNNVSNRVLCAADYGVPQLRRRLIILANRIGIQNQYPKPVYDKSNYVTVGQAIGDLKLNKDDIYMIPSNRNQRAKLSLLPQGSNLCSKNEKIFGIRNYREYWNRPSRTILCNLGRIHPIENRGFSLREFARLQSFPNGFVFEGTATDRSSQIGEAVPPLLTQHIGLAQLPLLQENADG